MRFIEEGVDMEAYTFNVVNDPSIAHYTFISALGKEMRRREDKVRYYQDCRLNCGSANNNICILQYTVSGEGVLEIGNKLNRQREGDFFLIERPGPYRYWIPEGSDHWELKFIEFSATGLPIWNGIVQSFGRCFNVNGDNGLMDLWDEIFAAAASGQIDSLFDNAIFAYKMLLTLHQHLSEYGTKSQNAESIRQCVRFIEENYAQHITLTDISAAGNLSPFYVNKVFKTVLGVTPIHYLTKVRVRHGMHLLYDTSLPIDDIAQQCGFQNANYFAKVFRKYVNVSPTDFRRQKLTPIIL